MNREAVKREAMNREAMKRVTLRDKLAQVHENRTGRSASWPTAACHPGVDRKRQATTQAHVSGRGS